MLACGEALQDRKQGTIAAPLGRLGVDMCARKVGRISEDGAESAIQVYDGPRPNNPHTECAMQTLYPQIKPYARHDLAVEAPHVLYVDESVSP